ncbi:MAG TPA: DUF4149 domain-containing protein [Burkholderiales bacterium]|nr:DUF4149 domain-containing protein [Burkholderiales bacterium]
MKPWAAGLYALLLAVWAGGLWTLGWVVPVLFANLQPVVAGNIAAQLFTGLSWGGLVCGAGLMALRVWALPAQLPRGRDRVLWALALMLLLTVVGHFGLGALMEDLRRQAAPLSISESPLRGRFGMLHGISSTLYLIQAAIAVVLVWRR